MHTDNEVRFVAFGSVAEVAEISGASSGMFKPEKNKVYEIIPHTFRGIRFLAAMS